MGFGNVWFVTLLYTVQAGSVHVSNRIQSTAGVCWGRRRYAGAYVGMLGQTYVGKSTGREDPRIVLFNRTVLRKITS